MPRRGRYSEEAKIVSRSGPRGYPIPEANARWIDGQRVVTRCLHCEWLHNGLAPEGRAAALAHRTTEHNYRDRRKQKTLPQKTTWTELREAK